MSSSNGSENKALSASAVRACMSHLVEAPVSLTAYKAISSQPKFESQDQPLEELKAETEALTTIRAELLTVLAPDRSDVDWLEDETSSGETSQEAELAQEPSQAAGYAISVTIKKATPSESNLNNI